MGGVGQSACGWWAAVDGQVGDAAAAAVVGQLAGGQRPDALGRLRPCAMQVLACLPPTPWSISEEEVAARRDLRRHRVFSIDPPTARDLDDALSGAAAPWEPACRRRVVGAAARRRLGAQPRSRALLVRMRRARLHLAPAALAGAPGSWSPLVPAWPFCAPDPCRCTPGPAVEELPDGAGYRVGVHIADVSHFVKPGSALDREAQERSTSGVCVCVVCVCVHCGGWPGDLLAWAGCW